MSWTSEAAMFGNFLRQSPQEVRINMDVSNKNIFINYCIGAKSPGPFVNVA